MGESEGKSPLKRHRHICEYHVSKLILGCLGVDWINPAEDRDKWRAVVNTARNVTGYIIFGKFLILLLTKNSASWS